MRVQNYELPAEDLTIRTVKTWSERPHVSRVIWSTQIELDHSKSTTQCKAVGQWLLHCKFIEAHSIPCLAFFVIDPIAQEHEH